MNAEFSFVTIRARILLVESAFSLDLLVEEGQAGAVEEGQVARVVEEGQVARAVEGGSAFVEWIGRPHGSDRFAGGASQPTAEAVG